MTFINEFTSPEDVEKYALDQVKKKYEGIGVHVDARCSILPEINTSKGIIE
ncbi:hypothetical protein [Variovorax paradoxus]|uniref:Uncharacterized protein n=1 Tax=Variovorax paradoxus TaxID=34073 RepID=A0A6I6HK72_VARPD|nr:hypothetical protein [Variovorax paradoxus]QGW83197.1 hypothetical protein GOQ09_17160 [Variovorax paradoxus]